jgi:hypothetical protein
MKECFNMKMVVKMQLKRKLIQEFNKKKDKRALHHVQISVLIKDYVVMAHAIANQVIKTNFDSLDFTSEDCSFSTIDDIDVGMRQSTTWFWAVTMLVFGFLGGIWILNEIYRSLEKKDLGAYSAADDDEEE